MFVAVMTAVLTNGKHLASAKQVDLMAGNFKTEELEVPEQFVEPNAAEQKQIAHVSGDRK